MKEIVRNTISVDDVNATRLICVSLSTRLYYICSVDKTALTKGYETSKKLLEFEGKMFNN